MKVQTPSEASQPKAAASEDQQDKHAASVPEARGADQSDDGGRPDRSSGEPLQRDADADSNLQAKPSVKQRGNIAVSSQPADDPNQKDPNERSDMISERRNPGQHGGGGDPGWKPSGRP